MADDRTCHIINPARDDATLCGLTVDATIGWCRAAYVDVHVHHGADICRRCAKPYADLLRSGAVVLASRRATR